MITPPRHLWPLLLAVLLNVPSALAATFTTGFTITETNLTYDGQDIVISGATVAIDGAHAFNSLLLTNGAVLTHSPCTALLTHKLNLTITNAVVVTTNSRIDVSAKGYGEGYTTGNTTAGGTQRDCGGSYGGRGGTVGGRQSNAVYGDYADPNDWGSGGGGGTFVGGVFGGGLVRLKAGTLVLDGGLVSDGASGSSGGGIRVDVGVLLGSGYVRAKGSEGPYNNSGCGGGGRIAVYASDYSAFDLSRITAPGGSQPNFAQGGPGTVYLRDTNLASGNLLITAAGGGTASTPLGLQGTNRTVFQDVVVVSGVGTSVVPVSSTNVLEFLANLVVSGGAQWSLVGSNTIWHAPVLVANAVLSVAGELAAK